MWRRTTGFSLVEVVVALSIMLILLPLSSPLYEYFLRDMKEAALKQRLAQVRRAIRLFYEDNRRFPNMLFDQYGNQVDFLDSNYSELVQGVHDGAGHYPVNRRRYLAEFPVDPFTERADWNLVRAEAPGDALTSRRAIQTATSTRLRSFVTRGVTSGTIRMLDNIDEVGGQVAVADVRSRTPGYESY